MTRANANALFQGLKSKASFTNVITIKTGDVEDKALRHARAKIRSAIRQSFQSFDGVLREPLAKAVLLSERDFGFVELAKSVRTLEVKFLTQGSHAYGTLIRPARLKHQEIDLDDGVYIPMPFRNGRPLFSSNGLFQVIEKALSPLVKSEGWSFERKDTCIRVSLTGQNAHIDLPLFAVETNSFKVVAESYQKQFGMVFEKSAPLNERFDGPARRLLRIGNEMILLADRKEDWRKSDPKAIHDWFIDQVEHYGLVLRRLCRYCKAWRDQRWPKCSLSSLALMVACVEALAALKDRPTEDRDDFLLMQVAQQLPGLFTKGNLTWRDGERPLDESWSSEDRATYVAASQKFADAMTSALEHKYEKDDIVLELQGVLGKRFPYAPESVDISLERQTAAVLETKAAVVAMPVVGTSVSA